MLFPIRTSQFKRDVKLAKKRAKDLKLLKKIMNKLANEEALDPKHRDHKLTGTIKIVVNVISNLTGCSFIEQQSKRSSSNEQVLIQIYSRNSSVKISSDL